MKRLAPILLLLAWLAAPALTRPARASDTPVPEIVTIPGTMQSELGCPGDWQPDCDKTFLVYDVEDDVWQGAFDLPATEADSRYKVALNKSWSENYGAKATRNGPDIPLVLAVPTTVKFYYDHKTHWVTDSYNAIIATVAGSFQSELGCASDGDPGCLRSWLQDPEGSGIYSFVTTAIPPGTYEAKVAINESRDETYGEGGVKNGPASRFTVVAAGAEVYFGYDPASHRLTISAEGAPRGNLGKAQAYWVAKDTIVWNVIGSPKYTYALHYDPLGTLKLEIGQIAGGQTIPLAFEKAGPGETVLKKFPHLAGFSALRMSTADVPKVPAILKGQIAVTVRDDQGKLVDATSLQIPGVLDDLYTYTGALGITYEGAIPTLRVWAPTARSVALHLFDDSKTTTAAKVPMISDPATGVWSATGSADWTGKFYMYEVEVYVPSTGRVEKNLVTDPYSFSLSTNSQRSQIVDLNDPSLMPAGWSDISQPALVAPEDIVLYELHVRDFSINDLTVSPANRGTFKAFTERDSNGMKHLQALADAGLTHIHLLPSFDVASIDEDKTQWARVDTGLLKTYASNSEEQQAALAPFRDTDGFNWGYDPYHYTVPEGSYATNPDGPTRILEFREMVQSLNASGLKVVMDVVYNHTNASGQSAKSVLDKIVPGYYHRLNANGVVENSTCCQNTATEHAMMEKLMIDSVITWARAYKVDGFRFDLMGHHMLSNMIHVQEALDALTPDQDGVDGSQVYVYGEGWDFGEVADNKRGQNATQPNIGGTGIGVFNDRLRDAARGGGPFSGLQDQGFLTGLFDDPNAADQRTAEEQNAELLHYLDWIRIGLSGNLRDYLLVNATGKSVTGADIDYRGKPAGYTLDPQENIVYISAHDNETLFDAIQLKAPTGASVADRVRMNNLGLSLVLLSQGIPFFHAGDDMLRSKSLDRNSYNSGDWFNALDFSYESNNWGVGLPPADNQSNWLIMASLLGDPNLKPTQADILNAATHFREMLQIRRSSPLFRLQTADDIMARLTFLNTGPEQIPGLIVMRLSDTEGADLDPNYEQVVVVFNAAREERTFADDSLKGLALQLHPVQAASNDPVVRDARFDPSAGALAVPGRTAAVFVLVASTAEPTATAPMPATAPAAAVPSATEAPTIVPSTSAQTLTWLLIGGAALAVVAGFLIWRRASTK